MVMAKKAELMKAIFLANKAVLVERAKLSLLSNRS